MKLLDWKYESTPLGEHYTAGEYTIYGKRSRYFIYKLHKQESMVIFDAVNNMWLVRDDNAPVGWVADSNGLHRFYGSVHEAKQIIELYHESEKL